LLSLHHTNGPEENLNSLLAYNGVSANTVRDNSVYRYNPSYWAMRPLSRQMIEWASSDVDKLLVVVASRQGATVGGGVHRMQRAMDFVDSLYNGGPRHASGARYSVCY
jgi:hypothetical protein